MQKQKPPVFTVLFSALIFLSFGAPAFAQETVTSSGSDILPVKSAEEANVTLDEANPTHPPVKLTPDKSELIRLDRKAAAVLIGNPAHLSILPEGSNTLVLVPKAPGATYFTVLDEENKIIMQRHVIVAGPKEKYVRIRKSCAASEDCQPTQVYYCPDMCHEIILNAEQEKKDEGNGGDNAAKNANEATNAENADEGADNSEETTEE